MSPLYHGYSGSTGTLEAMRVQKVIDLWIGSDQTSASWVNFWDNRDTFFREDTLHQNYVIGGGEANTPAGWYQYWRRLVGSTRNTSSGGRLNVLGLPNAIWRDFSTRVPVSVETTLTDNARGDHVYAVLRSTVANYQSGDGRGLLAAWAATSQTSNVGSS